MRSVVLFVVCMLLCALPCSGSRRDRAAMAVENLIPAPRSVTLLGRGVAAPTETVVIRDGSGNDEHYSIEITPRRIIVRTGGRRGEVWAHRTLERLRDSSGRYPRVRIDDSPEFPIRGFMWDDGRNFVGVAMIRHYLELMSMCKLNLFQWHLTDHPAWRIECRCHPELNDPRHQRTGRDTGCFYTYDQIREICSYAAELGITVVPEIDMPGHSAYFRSAFGCTMDSAEGRRILEECIAEFCAEIPAEMCPVIHIGSDEVRIADPAGFMEWSQRLLRSHGRRTMVWDPGLPADTMSIRQIWRDGSPDDSEIRTDTPFVDSSMGYLNYYDPLLFPAKMFFHTPCYTGHSSPTALGGILCMWNDVRAEDKQRIEHHNGMAAGMLTFAERFWNGGRTAEKYAGTILSEVSDDERSCFERFQQRVSAYAHGPMSSELACWSPIHATEWSVEMTTADTVITVKAFGDILDLDAISRAHAIAPDTHIECRISRTLYSPCDTVRLFSAGFDSPARSNRISDGIPPQGEWPNGGVLKVNGRQIPPPQWREPSQYGFRFNTWARPEEELPYTDEQLYWMLEPLPIALKKGQNTVELTLRRHFRGQRFHAAFVERQPADTKNEK